MNSYEVANSQKPSMADVISAANRDRFLTVRWNNALAAGLGVPILVFAVFALSNSAVSDRVALIGLVILGAFY